MSEFELYILREPAVTLLSQWPPLSVDIVAPLTDIVNIVACFSPESDRLKKQLIFSTPQQVLFLN